MSNHIVLGFFFKYFFVCRLFMPSVSVLYSPIILQHDAAYFDRNNNHKDPTEEIHLLWRSLSF